MIAYLVTLKGDSKGQYFSNKEEAEERAAYMNEINGVVYTVMEEEI